MCFSSFFVLFFIKCIYSFGALCVTEISSLQLCVGGTLFFLFFFFNLAGRFRFLSLFICLTFLDTFFYKGFVAIVISVIITIMIIMVMILMMIAISTTIPTSTTIITMITITNYCIIIFIFSLLLSFFSFSSPPPLICTYIFMYACICARMNNIHVHVLAFMQLANA